MYVLGSATRELWKESNMTLAATPSGVQVSGLYCSLSQNGHFDAQQPAIIRKGQIPNLSNTATKAS